MSLPALRKFILKKPFDSSKTLTKNISKGENQNVSKL